MQRNYKNDFPLFQNDATVYLDNAATAQRPACVLDAVNEFYTKHNANPLRGIYDLSVKATEDLENARETVRRFIGAEKPEEIIADIVTGIKKTDGKYITITNRKEAIAYAIHHGEPGDVIILAGKGHEDYQEIEGKKYPMDERVLIQEILEEDRKKVNGAE